MQNKIFTTLNEPLQVQFYSLVDPQGAPVLYNTLDGLPLGTVGNASDGELAVKVIVVDNRGPVGDVTAVSAMKATAAAPTYTEGSSEPVSGDLAGYQRVRSKQDGTWTVQPGNTANTTAWLVTGTGGTFPVTGTFWQATQPVSVASLPLPTGAATSAGVAVLAVGATNLVTSQVTAGSVATLVVARPTRKSVLIRNNGTGTDEVAVGEATVSSTHGTRLKAEESAPFTFVGLIQVLAITGTPVVTAADEYN